MGDLIWFPTGAVKTGKLSGLTASPSCMRGLESKNAGTTVADALLHWSRTAQQFDTGGALICDWSNQGEAAGQNWRDSYHFVDGRWRSHCRITGMMPLQNKPTGEWVGSG